MESKNKSLKGLTPVIDSRSAVLVLGTFPGPESLRLQQYYADRRNQFWGVMKHVFQIHRGLSYSQRLSLLLKRRVGLWDVIASCRRSGSLDRAIRDPVANPLVAFLRRHKSVRYVIFNGVKAHEYAWELIPKIFSLRNIVLQALTSTSGTNTHYTVERKAELWGKLRRLDAK
jgi:TDG/mug DNA glycosylase family protein